MHACIYVLHLCIYCVGKCAYLAIFSSQPWLCVLLWFLLSQIVRHSPLRAVASGLLYHLPGTQSWWLLGAVPVPRQKSQSAQPRRLSVNSMHMKMDQSSHTDTHAHTNTQTQTRANITAESAWGACVKIVLNMFQCIYALHRHLLTSCFIYL